MSGFFPARRRPPARRAPPTERPPQGSFRRRALLSRAEAEFHRLLHHAFGGELAVWPKVNLNDILQCTHPGDRYRIAQKHVDFLLVDPDTLAAVAAVELDDPSHDNPVSQLHDQAKDHFLGEADIAVVRIWLDDARACPPRELRRRILAVAPERVPYPGRVAWIPPGVARWAAAAVALAALWMLWRWFTTASF